MKSTEQVSSPAKNMSQAAKAKIARNGKPASRKSAASDKRTSRAATKRPLHEKSTFAGYSDSASRLIARGKTAFNDAYAWAGEKSSALPRTRSDLGLPDRKSLKAMIDDKPLIIGAVGLGIGVALGSILPTVGLGAKGKPAPAHSARRK
jgi:hypothetical protein